VKNYGTNLDDIKNQLHCEFGQNLHSHRDLSNVVEGLIKMKAATIQKHNESSKSGSSTRTKESENSDVETLRTGFSEESKQKLSIQLKKKFSIRLKNAKMCNNPKTANRTSLMEIKIGVRFQEA